MADALIKICILQSSYENSDSWHQEATHDDLGGGDPSKYIRDGYFFQNCFVRKTHEKDDIDEICKGDWDYYLNFLWAGPQDDVAGITAIHYLESKGVPIIGHTSEMLSKHYDKAAFYEDAHRDGLLVPSDTPDHWPKIVKFSNTTGSLGLTESSVCYSQAEVIQQCVTMGELNAHAKVYTQDFIIGIECSAIVLEMGREAVALEPLRYVFPDDLPPEKQFLTFDNKFSAIDKGIIRYGYLDNVKHKRRVQEAAKRAFKTAGMTGGAWARVDMRLETTTGRVFVLEVNPFPCIFCQIGNTFGDDMVVQDTFPGSHTAIMDILVGSHRIQHGLYEPQYPVIAQIHDKIAPHYDETSRTEPLEQQIDQNIKDFDFSGDVLDLGCGTGYVGELIRKHGHKAEVTGVDLSSGMTSKPSIQTCYKLPIILQPIQEYIFSVKETFDHVVCYSALHFFDNQVCTAVISRMFMLARKSVTFEIDDLSPEYLESFSGYADGKWKNWNNSRAGLRFPTPPGWKKVQDKYMRFYHSVHLDLDVYGRMYRYERMQ